MQKWPLKSSSFVENISIKSTYNKNKEKYTYIYDGVFFVTKNIIYAEIIVKIVKFYS